MAQARTTIRDLLLVWAALVVAGCAASTDDAQPDETQVVTVTVTATEPPAVLRDAPPEPAPAPAAPAPGAPAPAAPAAPTPAAPAAPADPAVVEGRIPDVVGLDHQLAQDTMQAAGFSNLSEEDATGQGRRLINDRNWTVVSQEPAAGATAEEDVEIILRSKKDDE